MTKQLTTYRVDITEWHHWTTWVDALSPEAARTEAKRRLFNDGTDDFKLRGCGIDSIEAEPTGPAEQGNLIDALVDAGRLEIIHIGDTAAKE